MPSLTTQSISIASANLPQQNNAAHSRAVEASQAAGLNLGQNLARAQRSATIAREDKDRSVQLQKRTEGSFAGNNPDEQREAEDTPPPTKPTGRLNRTA